MSRAELRCTHCDAAFVVDPRKIPAEGVRVRCSRCEGVFLARRPGPPETASEPVPADPAAEAPAGEAAPHVPEDESSASPNEAVPSTPDVPSAPDEEVVRHAPEADAPEATSGTVPSRAEPRSTAPREPERPGGDDVGAQTTRPAARPRPREAPKRDAPVTVASEYSAALLDVMDDVKASRTREPRRPRKNGGGVGRALVAVLVLLGASLSAWLNLEYRRVPEPPPESWQRAANIMLYNAIVEAERVRRLTGSPPADASFLRTSAGSWTYSRADTGYVITLTLDDVRMTHRSGQTYAYLSVALAGGN